MEELGSEQDWSACCKVSKESIKNYAYNFKSYILAC